MSLSETLSPGRILRTAAYLFVEFLALYVFLIGGLAAYLHFGLDAFADLSSNRSQLLTLLLVGYAIAMIPLTAAAVTIGTRFINGRRGDEWAHGPYAPVRPVAMLTRAMSNKRDESAGYAAQDSNSLVLAFLGGDNIDSLDILDRLSAMLDANGMEHTRMAGILVRDGSTRWGVDPDLSRPLLTVWCDSDNAAFRQQVYSGVRDFMANDMGLTVE